MNELLNSNIINELRDTINKTDIFIKDPIEKEKFNLICSIMDRFDSCINYINNHQNIPNTENDVINFLVYVSIIKDGINKVLHIIGLPKKSDNNIFRQYYIRDLPNINKQLDDDKFYEYFRSLAFAHPFVTDRSIPNAIDKNETQYSPYILTNLGYYKDSKDNIGVEVYSNKREQFSITFPFETLKEYVKWKYEMMKDATSKFEKIIENKEEVWKQHKVNRKSKPLDTLKEIKLILEERYMESYIIDELISYLSCQLTNTENTKSVNIFRSAIETIIPNICDAIDKYKNNDIYNIIDKIIEARPKGHPMMYYQLEKIYCYLNDDYGDTEWGLKQAEAFSKEFAKKWVIIEPYKMGFDEIKLLTSVACYLEYEEQKNKEKK